MTGPPAGRGAPGVDRRAIGSRTHPALPTCLHRIVVPTLYLWNMEYRTQLESLMTLTAEQIAQACAGQRINALVTLCYDEYLELRELAEEARGTELFDFYMQEASAWRDTARVLREIAAGPEAVTGQTRSA